ncbi:hypothetical protein J5837_01410 [Pseudoxanthomonas helianthi]|uniref:Uncharacterized protein n=1 Tax=Pseudoxanthomonas helianthi TaxID=1453541 RepID=A0A940WYY6_9GAMM|nr:hypothetical protein [Pseudoxanthomonas helianthi]MBP3983067.1 hypothetical protein [Pseudoxanthomonas helianthi]
MLALGLAMGAHAQTASKRLSTQLPIIGSDGKVQAVLVLEPTGEATAGARWRLGSNTLDAAFGLESGDSLGLACDRQTGFANSISSLVSYCHVAALDDDPQANKRVSATANLTRPGSRLGVSAGTGRDTLPAWLNPGKPAARVEQNDLTVFGEKNIGREGFVRIGGAVARARLVPAADLPAIADRWNSKSLTVGGGYGAFSANIIGRVVDTPGKPPFEGLGLGITWRTPWSGQLTVGAENVITRGKNPFAPNNDASDEGTVPYVRYEQDL